MIYNALGQQVRTLVDEHQAAGVYQVHWDARDRHGSEVAAGVYVTRLQYPGGVQDAAAALSQVVSEGVRQEAGPVLCPR